MKKKLFKILKTIFIILFLFIAIRLFSPTWTPSIKGENSISELTKAEINGVNLEVMIRGSGKSYVFGEDDTKITAATHADYLKAFLFGTEYNLLDAIGFYIALMKNQHIIHNLKRSKSFING